MILVKKLKFFHLLNLSKIDREKVFGDVLDKKEAFKHYKNQIFTKNAKLDFSKGVSPSFSSKIRDFLNFDFDAK